MIRTFRYRLDLSSLQAEKVERFAGVCRLIYNLGLEQRSTFHRQYLASTGRHISFHSQCYDVRPLRTQADWIAAVPFDCLAQALRDLDTAFHRFFTGVSKYPRFRKRGENDSFRFRGRDAPTKRLNAKWQIIRLPKIGWVKFRSTRPIIGVVKEVTVRRALSGWHVSLSAEIGDSPQRLPGRSVAIDRGIANTLALSTGERLSLPASLKTIDRRHRAAQRVLARRKRGSKRRAKALRRCAVLSARRARIRRDWHHKAALSIARRFGTVVLEDLKVKNMSAAGKGKRGLNRSILNQGWSIFEAILAYKLEDRGGTLIKVDPAYTSQACSACGTIDRESRESQASFACQHCGFREHADVNAAINILRRGNTAHLRVEDGQWPADEARSINRSAAA